MPILPLLVHFLLGSCPAAAQELTLYERVSHLNADTNIVLGSEAVSPPLHDLVRKSTLIVLGTVGVPTSYLSPDGTTINSEYPVQVSRVISGQIVPETAAVPGPTTQKITVTLRGGTLMIAGHRVRVINKGLPELPQATQVLLLLRERQPGTYELVRSVFGAYAVEGATVTSLSKRPGSHREFDGRPLDELVRAIAAAPKQ